MTVKELIKHLQRMKPDKEVRIINPNDVEFYIAGITERSSKVILYTMNKE